MLIKTINKDTLKNRNAVILKQMEADTILKKLAVMTDIANLAVFLSSDLAGKMVSLYF